LPTVDCCVVFVVFIFIAVIVILVIFVVVAIVIVVVATFSSLIKFAKKLVVVAVFAFLDRQLEELDKTRPRRRRP
jgi:hypothetical protein